MVSNTRYVINAQDFSLLWPNPTLANTVFTSCFPSVFCSCHVYSEPSYMLVGIPSENYFQLNKTVLFYLLLLLETLQSPLPSTLKSNRVKGAAALYSICSIFYVLMKLHEWQLNSDNKFLCQTLRSDVASNYNAHSSSLLCKSYLPHPSGNI